VALGIDLGDSSFQAWEAPRLLANGTEITLPFPSYGRSFALPAFYRWALMIGLAPRVGGLSAFPQTDVGSIFSIARLQLGACLFFALLSGSGSAALRASQRDYAMPICGTTPVLPPSPPMTDGARLLS